MQVLSAVPEHVALSFLHAALCGYRRGLQLPGADLSCRTLPPGLTKLQPQLRPLALRACAPCIDACSTLCLHLPDSAATPTCPVEFITEALPALTALTALSFTVPSAAHLCNAQQREASDQRVAEVLRTACRMPRLRALSLNLSAREPLPMGRYERMLPRSLADAVALRRLTLERVPLRAKSARQLAAALAKLPHLEALDLCRCGVDAAVAGALAQGFPVLTALRELGFCGESLTGHDAAEMLSALPRPGMLRRIEFEVSLTHIHGGHAERLAAAIGAATALRTLRLDQQGKTSCWGRCGSVQAVVRGLARHGTRCMELTRLEITANGYADVAHACGQLLCHLPELRMLIVRAVGMSAHGAAAFAQGLWRKVHLSHIDLSRSRVDAAGLHSLMAAIQALPALTEANLSGMVDTAEMPGWEAAEIFGRAMHGMQALTQLQLCYNALGPDGVRTLAHRLPQLRRLVTLDLSGNGMTGRGVASLGLAVCGLRALQELSLRNSKIDGRGAAHLESLLRGMTALTSLDVTQNPMGCEGAAALARGLEAAPPTAANGAQPEGPRRLQRLKLVCCGVGVTGMRVLASALSGLRQLRLVAVSGVEGSGGDDGKAFAVAMAAIPALAVTVDGRHVIA